MRLQLRSGGVRVDGSGGTGVFVPGALPVVRLALVVSLVLLMSGCWSGGTPLRLVPGDSREVLVVDVGEVRDALEGEAPWAYDAFVERVDVVLGDLSLELDYRELRRLAWARGPGRGDGVLVLWGRFDFEWVREDWMERGWDRERYRGREVWGGRAVLLEEQGLVVRAGGQQSVRGSLRLLGREERSAANGDGSDVGLVLERLGDAPLAVAFEASGRCVDAAPGCQVVGVGVTGYDGDSGDAEVVVVVLFGGERLAGRAVREYDELEEFMEGALHRLGESGAGFGGYRVEDVYLDDITRDGDFAVGEGVVGVKRVRRW